jgi:hypothetical protein
MNQAVRLSEVDNGEASTWTISSGRQTSDEVLNFYNNYLANYITTLNVKEHTNGYNIIGYLADGTIFTMGIWTGLDTCFYLDEKCLTTPTKRCAFSFGFVKPTDRNALLRTSFEPYSAGTWDGTREGLKNHAQYGCVAGSGSYCAKLIQYDGWEIKDDYPW